MATEICDQDVTAKLLAQDALIFEVLQKKHVAVQCITILDLVTFQGRAHLENITQASAVAV